MGHGYAPATWFVLSCATVRVLKFRSVDGNVMNLNDLIPRDEVDEGSLIKKARAAHPVLRKVKQQMLSA